MADTYSPLLRLILQEPLSNRNLWGNIWNGGVSDLIDDALGGVSSVDVTIGNIELATQNAQPDNSRAMFLRVAGTPIASRIVTVPTLSKLYVVINDSGQTISIKTALSSALTITPAQSPVVLFVDSANNVIRTIGRANAIVPMTAWTNFVSTFNNESGGPTNVTCRYARQGHFVFFEVPAFTVTTNGTLVFTETFPAGFRPGTAIPLVPSVQYLANLDHSGAAGAKFALFMQSNGVCGFTNIGTAAAGNPTTFTLTDRMCVVWTTRGP